MHSTFVLAAILVVAIWAFVATGNTTNEPFLPLLLFGGAGLAGSKFVPGVMPKVNRLIKSGKLTDGKGSGPGHEIDGQPFNTNGDFVALFQDTNFIGAYRKFAAGATQNSLSKGTFGLGILGQKENDTYSSALVPKGLQLTMYADNNMAGPSVVLGPGSYPNLGTLPQGNWNDRVSSLTVTRVGQEVSVTWYADKNFSGKKLQAYGAGSFPNLTTIQGIDSRNKMFSSVQVAPGYKVTFYNQPNFQGISGQFTQGSYPYVGDYWNDQVSSFKVYKA